MTTLELYSYTGRPSVRNNLYIAYFRSEEEQQDMLTRLLAVAPFNCSQGHYILKSTGPAGITYHYTDRPTLKMHKLLSDYKKLFRKAYAKAQNKVWSFAWQMGGVKVIGLTVPYYRWTDCGGTMGAANSLF